MVKWLKVINLLLDEFGVGYRAEIAKRSISSREVATMMEMTSKDGHSDLMKKIDKISKTLLSEKIPTVNYWFESRYIDGKGETVFRVISIRLNSIKNRLY